MFFGVRSRPIRTVLRWQLIVTAALALLASLPWGLHGAVSAALGGLVNVTAGWVFGWLVSRRKPLTAGEALRTMIRAEGVKILLIVAQLWAVLVNYGEIVIAAFLASFAVAVLVSTAAIAVPDTQGKRQGDS
jgi:ATP synthase protein I